MIYMILKKGADKVTNIYSEGIIITDNDGNVIDYNAIAKSILKEKEILNTNISSYHNELKDYQTFISHHKNFNIIIIKLHKNTNAFLEYVLEYSYDEIFISDGKGTVLYCNQAFETHYGIKRQDILGKDVQLLQEQGITDLVLEHHVIESKQMTTHVQHTATGKTIINTMTPILDDDGNVMYVRY